MGRIRCLPSWRRPALGRSSKVVLVLKPSAEGTVTFLKKGRSMTAGGSKVAELQAKKLDKEEFKPHRPADALADFIFEVIVFELGDASDGVILKDPHRLVRFKPLEDWNARPGATFVET